MTSYDLTLVSLSDLQEHLAFKVKTNGDADTSKKFYCVKHRPQILLANKGITIEGFLPIISREFVLATRFGGKQCTPSAKKLITHSLE